MLPVVLLFIALTQQSAPKAIVPVQSPKRIECTVEVKGALTCFDEEAEREFPLTITSRHPWAKYLDDTQPGVSKVVIEQRGNRRCLMQVHVQGDWVRNPVNERINVCVPVRRTRRKP